MERYILHSRRLFFRTPILPGACLFAYIMMNGYLIAQESWLRYRELATYLNKLQAVGVLLFFLFSIVSYEFLFQEKQCGLDECLLTNRTAWLRFKLSRLVLLLPPIVVNSLTVLAYMLMITEQNGALTRQVLTHLVLNCLLNVFWVQCIAILLGAVLSLMSSRPTVYGILLLLSFLMTPTANYIISLFPITVGKFQFDLVFLADIFRLTALDTTWLPDPIYGFPIEPYRWSLVVFWIAVLLGIFLLAHRQFGCKRRKFATMALFVVAAVGFGCFCRVYGDSIVCLDDRMNGTLFGNYYYETTHEQQEKKADFSVLSYQLELSAKARLYTKATISVTRNTESDHYFFTLYRGYKIRSITDDNGNQLPYTRDGHYVDIVYPMTAESGAIHINYQGSGGKYYSNYQGIALPGYIPWYPMPGYLCLWDKTKNEICCNVPDSETEFIVTIDSDLPIVCNLELIGNKTYAGTAPAVTIIGGLLTEKKTTDGLNYYDSPLNLKTLDLTEVRAVLKNAEDILGISFGIDFDTVKIFSLPNTISKSGSGEGVAVMGDHLLLNSQNIVLESALLEDLIPDKTGAEQLRTLLTRYYLLYDSDTEEPLNTLSDLTELPETTVIANMSEAGVDHDFEVGVMTEQLLRYQMVQYDKRTVLRDCFEYLCSNDTQSQLEFLYSYRHEKER